MRAWRVAVPVWVVVVAVASVVACAGGGPTDDSASRPATVVITPATVSLVTGSSQQFTAVAHNAQGQELATPVVYAATGGSITTGGFYTAGTTLGSFTVTATAENSTARGTATVTIVAPPVDNTPASLVLEPPTVTLAPSGTWQFTATVRNAANAILGTPVTFSATGGTISAGGLYTAGASVGTYVVIARVTGGTLADTSAVNISAPPAGAFTPNQPPGMTLLATFPFTDNTAFFGGSLGSSAGFQFASAPFSPDRVARFVYPAGPASGFYTGGAYPPTLPAGTVKVYIAYNWRLSPDFTLHPGNTKCWYFYRQIDGISGSLVVGWDRTGGTLATGSFELNGQPQTAAGPGRMGHNQPLAPTLTRDTWFHTEILAVMNTNVNTSDGILRVWVNGILTLSYTNVRYSESGQPLEWREVHLDPYYGGETPGHTIPSTQYLYVDHAIISTSTSR